MTVGYVYCIEIFHISASQALAFIFQYELLTLDNVVYLFPLLAFFARFPGDSRGTVISFISCNKIQTAYHFLFNVS